MRKKLLMAGLLFTLIFTLNSCYSDDPQPNSSVAEVPNSSFSESMESINEADVIETLESTFGSIENTDNLGMYLCTSHSVLQASM